MQVIGSIFLRNNICQGARSELANIIYFLAFPTRRAITISPTEIKPAKNFSKPPVAQIASPNVEFIMFDSYSSGEIFNKSQQSLTNSPSIVY